MATAEIAGRIVCLNSRWHCVVVDIGGFAERPCPAFDDSWHSNRHTFRCHDADARHHTGLRWPQHASREQFRFNDHSSGNRNYGARVNPDGDS